MGKSMFETLVGALVLMVAVTFVILSYTRSNVAAVQGYEVSARFSSIGGLKVGDDVRFSGIKVGTVTDQSLDPAYYDAVVRMSIESSIELPVDTQVKIASEGLLGGNYVSVLPGGEDDLIKPGGEIKYSQGHVDIIDLFVKFGPKGDS